MMIDHYLIDWDFAVYCPATVLIRCDLCLSYYSALSFLSDNLIISSQFRIPHQFMYVFGKLTG